MCAYYTLLYKHVKTSLLTYIVNTLFTVIDMKDGFWQIKLAELSSRPCTFTTQFGRYPFFSIHFAFRRCQKCSKSATLRFLDTSQMQLWVWWSNYWSRQWDGTLCHVLEWTHKYNLQFNKESAAQTGHVSR